MPRFPPTAIFIPAFSAISASKVVTVLFPFEPVIATIGALAYRANSSISPTISTPAALAAAISGKRGSMPGLNTIISACFIQSRSKPPVLTTTSGYSCCSTLNDGGNALVSIMATSISWCTKNLAHDNPVLPNPMIRQFVC